MDQTAAGTVSQTGLKNPLRWVFFIARRPMVVAEIEVRMVPSQRLKAQATDKQRQIKGGSKGHLRL